MVTSKKTIAIIIFICAFLIYFLTSAGNTPYNQYTLLGKAFLQGRLYITKVAPWLEKVPIDGNNFFIANPPMPAIIAMPFVAVFGERFPQQVISWILGAGVVVLAFLISLKIKNSIKLALFSSLLIGFANIFWFIASVGSMWYLAQVVATFFVLLAIFELYNKKRVALITVFVGFAFLARVQAIFFLPFFIYILSDKKSVLKNIVVCLLAILPAIFVFGIYNYLRFRSPLETGLRLIPGLVNEPWFNRGLFSPSYIPPHLKILLYSFPSFSNKFPFVFPTLSGLAIWLTSPVFVFSLLGQGRNRLLLPAWITIIFIILLDLAYGSSGISQFGYRYAIDIYPLIFLLVIENFSYRELRCYHWIILALSVLVNLWGVVLINKLGFVA